MKPSDALKVHRAELRDLVVRNAALHPRVFGSTIHGDDTEDSDLDLLVDPTSRTALMTLAAIQIEAERLLGVRVDVLTPKSLPQRFRDRVLLEAATRHAHVPWDLMYGMRNRIVHDYFEIDLEVVWQF